MKGKAPTKAEKEWMNRISDIGCIVCKNEGYGYTPSAVHHIDGKTKPGAHFNTIPLCPTHHQTGHYGVALHQGRVAFEKRYGTQQELLEQVKSILND